MVYLMWLLVFEALVGNSAVIKGEVERRILRLVGAEHLKTSIDGGTESERERERELEILQRFMGEKII